MFSEELTESQEKGNQLTEENSALKSNLSEAQVDLAKKSDMVIDLQGKRIFLCLQVEVICMQ